LSYDEAELLLFLPQIVFSDVFLRILLEGVAAAGAADVIGHALEADRNGADAAGDDAFIFLAAAGERLTLLGAFDLVLLGEDGPPRPLPFEAIDEAGAVAGGVHLEALRFLAVRCDAIEDEDFV